MTVFQNVAFGLRLRRLSREAIRRRVDDVTAPGGAGSWRGRIERVLDLDAFRMLDIRLDGGPPIKAQAGKAFAAAIGDAVALRARAVVAFDEAGRASPATPLAEPSATLVTLHG